MKLFLIALGVAQFLGNSYAASVIFTKGEILLNSKPAKVGDSLAVGQHVESGANSMAILDLEGGSKFKLEPNSKVQISALNHPQKGSLLELVRGNILVKARKIKDKKDLLGVSARLVSLGVRGTLFFVGIDDTDNKSDVWMCVEEGEVLIKGKDDKSLTKVRAKEGVVVKNAQKASKPTFFPWTSKINWELDQEKSILSNENALKEAYLNPLRRNYD